MEGTGSGGSRHHLCRNEPSTTNPSEGADRIERESADFLFSLVGPRLGSENNPMKWITREKIKVDRVACPWLITRFIDPEAEFLFVSADRVLAEAEQLGATAFDTPDATLNHRGELVTFEAMLDDYNL